MIKSTALRRIPTCYTLRHYNVCAPDMAVVLPTTKEDDQTVRRVRHCSAHRCSASIWRHIQNAERGSKAVSVHEATVGNYLQATIMFVSLKCCIAWTTSRHTDGGRAAAADSPSIDHNAILSGSTAEEWRYKRKEREFATWNLLGTLIPCARIILNWAVHY